jgi:hypothetical protein
MAVQVGTRAPNDIGSMPSGRTLGLALRRDIILALGGHSLAQSGPALVPAEATVIRPAIAPIWRVRSCEAGPVSAQGALWADREGLGSAGTESVAGGTSRLAFTHPTCLA